MSIVRQSSMWWAAGLVLGGLVLLLFNFGLFDRYTPLVEYIAAGALALPGLALLVRSLMNRAEWPRLVPAWTLLALAGMVLLAAQPDIDPAMVASLLLLGLGLGFWNIYFIDRGQHWWAIIPGGFMLALAAIIALSGRIENMELLAAILFAGLGLTFLLLYWLAGAARHWWALAPGGVLLIFALFIFALQGLAVDIRTAHWWPLLLILAGLGIGLASYQRRAGRSSAPAAAPETHPAAPSPQEPSAARAGLGAYTQPAPGASVEVLRDPDE